MSEKSRQLLLIILFAVSALLPLGGSLLFLFSRIIEKFGDDFTVTLLDNATATILILWGVDLFLLVLATVWKTLVPEIIDSD